MLDYEIKNNFLHLNVIGLDEAGRGAWAGPVVVAGCVLNLTKKYHEKINDSKKLNEKDRQELSIWIKTNAKAYSIKFINSDIVDQIGPKKASQLGMQQCLTEIISQLQLDVVITDFEKIDTSLPLHNLIKGDQKSINVAAASILAKVARDNFMIEKSSELFSFHKHKGYGTKLHQEELLKNGVSQLHRKSYAPIKKILKGI
ncbi:ribonuclease HII [Mycoplasma buteonis]|uniref:ribonuclease HII n=1 Tax=Mycoplasma buteonis TaxID=171280 RepID=UPI00055D3401|nr:ribonuclease HII [Mycoplasma buteonis]